MLFNEGGQNLTNEILSLLYYFVLALIFAPRERRNRITDADSAITAQCNGVQPSFAYSPENQLERPRSRKG